jgi:hypothetical protein
MQTVAKAVKVMVKYGGRGLGYVSNSHPQLYERNLTP